MPVCLKCGWEIVYGPGGCACTQAARREREAKEAKEAGERLVALILKEYPNFGKAGAMEDLTGKTIEELRAVLDAGEAAGRELGRRYAAESKKVEERMNAGTDPFKAEELEFAKESVCPCGAKLAYPKGSGPHGSWDCSAILMGTSIHKGEPGAVTHTDRKPFAFWKVK